MAILRDARGGVAFFAHVGGFVAGLLLAVRSSPGPIGRDTHETRRARGAGAGARGSSGSGGEARPRRHVRSSSWNVLVSACQHAAGEASDYGIPTWGLTPERPSIFPPRAQPILTLFTSMFLRRLVAPVRNMIFLWIFPGRVSRKRWGLRGSPASTHRGALSAMVQVLAGSNPASRTWGERGRFRHPGRVPAPVSFRPISLLALTAIHPGLLGTYILLAAARRLAAYPNPRRFTADLVRDPDPGVPSCRRTAAGASTSSRTWPFATGVPRSLRGANFSRTVRMPE
jgi:membrane associated rhomboid family serine protease